MSTPTTARADVVTDPVAHHGEGPVWDPATRALHWVDMLAGDVLSLRADGAVRRIHVGNVVAALRPRAAGGFVVAVERGFAVLDESWQPVRPVIEVWTDPGVRMNEGSCDPRGRFYCGSMAYDAAPGRGALYRLDPDGSVETMLRDVTISNGLVWSDDGARAWYVDTPTQRVDVFDVDPESGGLTNRRPFVEIPAAQGSPDGITLDAEGGLWVALWGGGAVHRYTPDGRLHMVVGLPVRQATACAFGGPNLDELYITTSRIGLSSGQEPLAGALFVCRPGVLGLEPFTYAG
jgi:sugar lactone lactonase YvrE